MAAMHADIAQLMKDQTAILAMISQQARAAKDAHGLLQQDQQVHVRPNLVSLRAEIGNLIARMDQLEIRGVGPSTSAAGGKEMGAYKAKRYGAVRVHWQGRGMAEVERVYGRLRRCSTPRHEARLERRRKDRRSHHRPIPDECHGRGVELGPQPLRVA